MNRFVKTHSTQLKLVIAFSLFFIVGCGGSSLSIAQPKSVTEFQTDTKTFPPLPAAEKIEDGVFVHKVRLNQDDDSSDLWIYLPENQTKEKIPAILVTAAGSYLWNGTSLDKGDQPEHLPYVRNGFAVIAYETPGSLDGMDLAVLPDEQLGKAVTDFKNSEAGLVQARNALNYTIDKIQVIDKNSIYTAGHSSAATHSLLVAANEPRVKAAIAYAPATDLEKRLAGIIGPFNNALPGYRDFIKRVSPKNNISKIKMPVFIFHAENDSVISIEDTKKFVAELKKVNPDVTFVTTDVGDHYESMIRQGIPKAIAWLNSPTR